MQIPVDFLMWRLICNLNNTILNQPFHAGLHMPLKRKSQMCQCERRSYADVCRELTWCAIDQTRTRVSLVTSVSIVLQIKYTDEKT